MAQQLQYLDRLYRFNQIPPSHLEERFRMLQEMFAEVEEGCYIESPLHTNMGGHHVHFGKNVYANVNLALVDDTHIYVGDNTVVGAGSVVTRDLPANVVAVGNPCRGLRPIGEKDRKFYHRDRPIDSELFDEK